MSFGNLFHLLSNDSVVCVFVHSHHSPLKVRYPKRAASRYMRNMARKDTLATPCIFLRERLFKVEEAKVQVRRLGFWGLFVRWFNKENPLTLSAPHTWAGWRGGTRRQMSEWEQRTRSAGQDKAFKCGPLNMRTSVASQVALCRSSPES